MTSIPRLLEGNRAFASERFNPDRKMGPGWRTVVITCFDPRVDPAEILGATAGQIGVLRDVGGRVTPHTIRELITLQQIARAAGSDLGPGWDIVVMQHTDCGITRVKERAELLSPYFDDAPEHLAEWSVGDPFAATRRDVELLRTDEHFAGATISGLVYDVATGLVQTVDIG